MPKSDNDINRLDAWSGTHLFGSFALAIVLMTLFPSRGIFDACLITFCLGIIWECLDNLYKLFYHYLSDKFPQFTLKVLKHIWDKRGFSWLDLVMDFIGCAGAGLCLGSLL